MTATKPQSFAALRHPAYRTYFITSALAMMADSIEHVISYWMMFQKFQSPALGGFAVIAHWLPFLLFSMYSGALADRFELFGYGIAAIFVITWGGALLLWKVRGYEQRYGGEVT